MARSLQYNKDREMYEDKKCLRCGDKLNPHHWGDSHSNGTIHLDHPSQIFIHLLNQEPGIIPWQDVKEQFDHATLDHPFYDSGHGQVANFSWDAGEMCEDCHTELVRLIGGFFFGTTVQKPRTINVEQSTAVNAGTMIGYRG